jgi:hypothetical protein
MSAGNCFGENVHQYVTFVKCYIFSAFFKTISATNYISANAKIEKKYYYFKASKAQFY